jgi:hypothetical protein
VPPPLSLPPPRRPSSISRNSFDSLGRRSPSPDPLDSSAALILVHDEEEERNPFDIDDADEDDGDDDDDGIPSQFIDLRKASIPPLRPSLVLLYLLSPYLKLGAMFLLNTELPIQQGLPPLLAFALLSAFSRQLWFMLGRYIRRLDMEDVILDAFARGRDKERRREFLRSIIRAGTGALRVLISAVYLRGEIKHFSKHFVPGIINLSIESTNIFLSIFTEYGWTARVLLTAIIIIVLLPAIFATSLASKSVVYATWLSIGTYALWLSCVIYSYVRGISLVTPGWLKMGAFWQGIGVVHPVLF